VKIMTIIPTALSVAVMCATGSGCSIIGANIGGAPDRTDNDWVDSVALNHAGGQLSDESAQAVDTTNFASILKKAARGQNVLVSVVTATGTLVGDGIAVDTDFVLRSEGSYREGLLPGDSVSLILRDISQTHISGKVRWFKAGYIDVGGEDVQRGYPFGALNAIYLNDGRVITAQDLSSVPYSDRFILVPVLVLEPEVSCRRVPLSDVKLIRAAKSSGSGTGRVIGFGIGLALDILVTSAIIETFTGSWLR